MSQQTSSSHGQIRLRSEEDESEGKQIIYAPDRVCPICKGAERLRIDVPYDDPSFGKSILCSCLEDRQKILRQQQLRQAADIDAFRDCTFKTFDHRIPGVQKAVRISLAYALHPQGWLLLVGPCGCGKTHLAAAIANQCLENGIAVFFTTAPDLLDTLRAALVVPEQELNSPRHGPMKNYCNCSSIVPLSHFRRSLPQFQKSSRNLMNDSAHD